MTSSYDTLPTLLSHITVHVKDQYVTTYDDVILVKPNRISTAEGETLFLDGDSITHLFFMSDRFDGNGDVTSASPFS